MPMPSCVSSVVNCFLGHMLCDSYFEKEKEIEYFKMLKGNKVDGIILGSRNMDISEAIKDNLPLVTIDRILGDNIPCISSDNYKGGMLATEHLIKKGCKKIALISGSPSLHLMANQRSIAYVDTCKKNGIEPIVVSTNEDQFTAMTYYNEIHTLFKSHPDIDGIFASSDIIAAQVIQVAAEAGLKIPDDTSIARLTTPQLTTIHQPIEQISKYALELIINEIKGEIVPMRTVLPIKLVERGSA